MDSNLGKRMASRRAGGPKLTPAVYEEIRNKYFTDGRLTEELAATLEVEERELMRRWTLGEDVSPKEVMAAYGKHGDVNATPWLLQRATSMMRQTRPDFAENLELTNPQFNDFREWALTKRPSPREIEEKIASDHPDPRAHAQHRSLQRVLEQITAPASASSLQSSLRKTVHEDLKSFITLAFSQHAPVTVAGISRGIGRLSVFLGTTHLHRLNWTLVKWPMRS